MISAMQILAAYLLGLW